MKKIVFTGGGTLGHVMPNIFLMEELKKDNKLYYIGSNSIEKDRVGNLAEFKQIPATKLVRGKVFVNFKIPFVLMSAIFQAKKILKEIKPDIIFSKGGYVSLPVCIAGRMLKIPIIAHESDYSFGLANKIILKMCDQMCVNFENLTKKSKKIIYTGPIFSKSFESKKRDGLNLNLDKNKPTLLIVGGSLGSAKINDIVYSILNDILENFNVIHITGKGNKKLNSYQNYNAFTMVDDMCCLYNNADFVIGRSGAGVTAECFYKHLPMILIPLENKATRGDQLQNAKYYENLGVANILRENDLSPTSLLDRIDYFYKNLDKYAQFYKDKEIVNGKDVILKMINECK